MGNRCLGSAAAHVERRVGEWMRAIIWVIGIGSLIEGGLIGCDDDEGTAGGVESDASLEMDTQDGGDGTSGFTGTVESIGSGDPRFDVLVNAVETSLRDIGPVAAAVAVVEGGEVTFARGFGHRKPNGDTPVTADTLFRIGSVTKMLTATALLQQVEVGRASLDDRLIDHFPAGTSGPENGWLEAVTLTRLLTHTSGIVDYLEIDATSAFKGDDGLRSFLLDRFPDIGYPLAPPGRFFNYSNPGYCYIGLLVEILGGMAYSDYMATEVFRPLGMTRTVFRPDDVVADGNFARGLVSTGAGEPRLDVGPETYDNPWGYPAGYAWSSVLDLARFVSFLRDGDPAVLSDRHRAEMISPKVNTGYFRDIVSYGFGILHQRGLFVGNSWYDMTVLSHDGGIPGYFAELYYVPSLDIAFISLVGASNGSLAECFPVALESLTTLPTPGIAPSMEMPAEALERLAGVYVEPHDAGDMSVLFDGENLKLQIPAFDAAGVAYEPVLSPLWPDNFIFTVEGADMRITFLYENETDLHPKWIRSRIAVAERTDTYDIGESE